MSQRFFSPLVFLIFSLIQIMMIVARNNGFFTYVLDDPYIHMALSENLFNGHYGANIGEYSSPSSSVFWPVLLTPFVALGKYFVYVPMFLNLLFGAVLCYFVSAITELFWKEKDRNHMWKPLKCILDVVFILALNIVGIVFTGMEHSLQVLLGVYVLYCLLKKEETGSEFGFCFWLCLFLGPLIRYENMAISVPVLAYCFYLGHYKKSVFVGLGIISVLASFSVFLTSIGQDYLPASINAKDSVITSGNLVVAMFSKFFKHMHYLRRDFSFVILILFGIEILKNQRWKKQNLSFSVPLFLAMLLHLFFGDFGWFSRYEIYMWSFCLLGVLYLKRDSWLYCFYRPKLWPKVFSALMLLVLAQNYKHTIVRVASGANNIYEQQYQMHRFVKYYYQKPVAANDIGYLLFDNPHHILDLWGLASIRAQKMRLASPEDSSWMGELVAEKDIGLVMIYEEWFPDLPESWKKLGELHLGGPRSTVADSKVSFFASKEGEEEKILIDLQNFVLDLPAGVSFKFQNN